MIIAKFKEQTGLDVVIGITRKEVNVLLKGGPIELNLRKLGIDLTAMIVFEEKEQMILDKLAEFTGPETRLLSNHDEGNA